MFLRHRSVSGCPRVNSSVCPEEHNNNSNSGVKRNCPLYSDDEDGPQSMFIKERCLSNQTAPKDINELKEKSKEFEFELIKLKSEFNDINNDYDLLRNVSTGLVNTFIL